MLLNSEKAANEETDELYSRATIQQKIAPTPNQSYSKPRESLTEVVVKTVKGKEIKSDTQQIIEELRKEIKQMFMTAMETSPRTMALKKREKGCKKCREEGKGESFKCGREGHSGAKHRDCRWEMGRDY